MSFWMLETFFAMQIDFQMRGIFADVTGTEHELNYLEDILEEWACQLDPKGSGIAVALRIGPEHLQALSGAILSLPWCHETQPPPDVLQEAARATQLQAAGILRPFQAEAAAEALRAPWGRSIVTAPTGAGKTYIAAGIIACGPFDDWTYVVQNQELAAQTGRKFADLIPQMREVLGLPARRVRCVSYADLGPTDALICDEVHGAAAATRADALARCGALFRCGLSATPLDRCDAGNAHVVGLFGPSVYSISIAVLEREGFLASSRVSVLDYEHK